MNRSGHRIRIAGSEVEFACDGGDTLLRAAQRAGLGFPYECNVGSCGNCRFELAEGEVDTAWPQAPAWTDKDRQRRRHLGCQSRPTADCTIKLRLDDHYAPVHRPRRGAAVLESRRTVTHDIAEFRFVLDVAQEFEPGQYALAWLPGVAGPRAWSMSNTAAGADAGKAWEFQVRRVPGGQGSAALFDALRPGDGIVVDGPYGMAWLRREAPRDIVCLAGGSGLAPMISIARGAMVEPRLAGRHLHFVYGGRTAADLCGQDMLRALPGWGERLSYHGFVSAPPPGGAALPPGVGTGFVHEAARQLLGERLRAMEVYFAGPPAMATAVQRMLLDAGVPPGQQHFDQFY